MTGRLRVAVDGFNIAMPHGTGVATYARALVETLRASDIAVEGVFGLAAPPRERLREIMFFDELGRGPPTQSRWGNLRTLLTEPFTRPRPREIPRDGLVERAAFADRLPHFDRLWSASRLFERAERHFRRTERFLELRLPDPPAIMHWTYPLPIRLVGAHNIYTIHDLVPLKLPYTTLDHKRRHVVLLDACARTADHICTVSEASRRDMLAMLAISSDRVTNTYQATPARPADLASAEDDAQAIRGLFGLELRDYFLYFGALEPKKNVGRLIEAYLGLATDTPLVIVGARAWAAEEELRLLRADRKTSGAFGRSLDRRIVELGYLPRALLMRLVRGAKAVVFPSLYEGFGLPVLEAMELGTPVITATTGSLPEVAGDAALLVDPYSVAAIAGALRRIDGEPGIGEILAARGRVQATKFSNEHYRNHLQTMYGQVMAQPRRCE